jgi:hypothetical protein
MKIVPDAFGWFLIRYKGQTLQAFRSEKECRQWLADTLRIRTAMGVLTSSGT